MKKVLILALGRDQIPILQSLVDVKPDFAYLLKGKKLLSEQEEMLDSLSRKFRLITVDSFNYKDVFEKVTKIMSNHKKSLIYLDTTTGTKSILIGLLHASAFADPRNVKLVIRDILSIEKPYNYSELKTLPKSTISHVTSNQKQLLKKMDKKFISLQNFIKKNELNDSDIERKKLNYNIKALEKNNLVETKKDGKEILFRITFLGEKYSH